MATKTISVYTSKMAKAKKTASVHVRLTEEQLYHLELAAEKLGMSVPAFLRAVAVQKAMETIQGDNVLGF